MIDINETRATNTAVYYNKPSRKNSNSSFNSKYINQPSYAKAANVIYHLHR